MNTGQEKKRLLLVAYYFPPVGGGGVQRTVKFAKYLPETGWDPVVLTVKDILYRSYDPTPLDDLSKTTIVRAGSLDPFRLARIINRLTGRRRDRVRRPPAETFEDLEALALRGADLITNRAEVFAALAKYLAVPDIQVGWAPFAFAAGVRLCRESDIKVVYTTSPPESAHFIGWAIRKVTGSRWVADFRDTWDVFWRRKLPGFYRSFNRTLEEFVLRSADGLVLNTEPYLDRVRSVVGPRKPVIVIPNGFDPADFSGSPATRKHDKFIVAHVGNFGTGLDARALLKAFALVRADDDGFRRSAKMYLIGIGNARDVSLVEELDLSDAVFFTGYLSYRAGLRFLKAADLLLLMMGRSFEAERVPGKFYEYLGAGAPVLTVVPPGEALRLARELYGSVYEAQPDDIGGIARALREAFDRWRLGEPPFKPDSARAACYERRKQAADLGRFLTSLFNGDIPLNDCTGTTGSS